MSSYDLFLISQSWLRKDGCADYSYMTEGVHDEGSDGQGARSHISAEHYNYNFHRHPKYYCNCPFKLKRPLVGEHQPRVRTFLWLVFVFRTCSRGDIVHSCASKVSPGAVVWRCPGISATAFRLQGAEMPRMRGCNDQTQLAMSTLSRLNRTSCLFSHRFWYATYGSE